MTLDRRLLDEARALGLNLSRAAEAGLALAIRAERQRRWREENAAAIADYNAFIEANGVPLSAFRKFWARVARQFDLWRTPAGTLVVVVQSDLFDAMRTRVVAPCSRPAMPGDRFAG